MLREPQSNIGNVPKKPLRGAGKKTACYDALSPERHGVGGIVAKLCSVERWKAGNG